MNDAVQSKLKKGVIRLNINDTRNLYQAYMPFIEGCGMFYPTEDSYQLGQEVFVFLQLPEDHGKFAVSGRVAWLNPPKKSGKRVPGIGIQLTGRDVSKIRETIERAIGKMGDSGLPTMTL
ncbi:PilZ domain-containing protein [Suttonella sp. R2A3]|uniref:PilZ domain-containing protein n=1 Tax=Suttonella sp. R2A3 TaxID=2908648 RepID=UPI001F167650|nr:PilZ domain-containing protein [Suttonella sp. R2A3]UJF24098.1 PilZ domain-containing protein [Suttonella sp. R2A3]